jgi:hypothetical protein
LLEIYAIVQAVVMGHKFGLITYRSITVIPFLLQNPFLAYDCKNIIQAKFWLDPPLPKTILLHPQLALLVAHLF